MTGPQRWTLFGVMTALLIGSWIALCAIDEFVPHGGIVQFELNGAAGAHVWRSGVATVWSLIVDYPFLIAYGFVFSLVMAFCASLWNTRAHDADVAATEAEAAARALAAQPPSMERLRLSKIALDKRDRHAQLVSITMAASVLAWLPLVAAALDSMENAFLLGYLAERPSWTADVARWFAISKFAVLALAAVVLVFELIGLLTRPLWAKD
jgi:hypothetical protein